jgi:hypothetical protein
MKRNVFLRYIVNSSLWPVAGNLTITLESGITHTMSSLPPRATLQDLPRELQDAIVTYFKPNRPRTSTRENCYMADRTLLDLSYTCKSLRAACLPIVYKDIDFTAYISRSDRSPGREAALLRTLSSPIKFGEHVKTLSVNNLDPADRTAEQLLEYTPKLTLLSYRYSLDYYENHDPEPIDTKRLTDALKHVSGTLKHLMIGYKLNAIRPRPPRDQRAPPVPHLPCSLKHLAVLEDLTIPLDVLLGWRIEKAPALADVLPPNLVNLYFEMSVQQRFQSPPESEPMFAMLKPFVEGGNWKESTPKLKNVSGHISIWATGRGTAIPGGMPELYRRSKALKKLLTEHGLEYPEDVRRLLEDNGLLPIGDFEKYTGGQLPCTSDLMEWEELEFEDGA